MIRTACCHLIGLKSHSAQTGHGEVRLFALHSVGDQPGRFFNGGRHRGDRSRQTHLHKSPTFHNVESAADLAVRPEGLVTDSGYCIGIGHVGVAVEKHSVRLESLGLRRSLSRGITFIKM